MTTTTSTNWTAFNKNALDLRHQKAEERKIGRNQTKSGDSTSHPLICSKCGEAINAKKRRCSGGIVKLKTSYTLSKLLPEIIFILASNQGAKAKRLDSTISPEVARKIRLHFKNLITKSVG